MHQNVSLGSNGVDWVRSLRKILMQLHGTTFCTSSARFAPGFVRQPTVSNAPKRYETRQNVSLRSNGVDWVLVFQKNSDATSWHELLHLFGPFCIEFCKATKQSGMHPNSTNAPKCQFRVTWGGSGAFVAKNSDATSWHELLH